MKEFVFSQLRMPYLLCCHPSSFIEEARCPLLMGSRRFRCETEGEGGAMFACYDLLFALDSQIVRIFYSMMRLTSIRVVTCVTHGWLFVQAQRG